MVRKLYAAGHVASICACILLTRHALAADADLAAAATSALERSASFFVDKLAVKGGYVWKYSKDLSVRRGEGEAGTSLNWTQPPGTPAVGAAYLRIFEATGSQEWLDGARASALSLVDGQLLSGGWYYHMETSTAARSRWCYRVDHATQESCAKIAGNQSKNITMLDDDTTQSALRFLLWYSADAGSATESSVREAIDYGLARLRKAQYRNGAFPAMFDKKRNESAPAGIAATLPSEWSRDWVKPGGGPYFILNDNALCDTAHLFLLAAHLLRDAVLREPAIRAADFLLDAQLPEPQAGWAQTYDKSMQPVWGRKFEPPAVASRETATAIEFLVEMYGQTGDVRYLDAARRAAAWLRSVRLADGDWSRFYELGTNKPLYVDMDEKLTYAPLNLLDHYSLKGTWLIPQALRRADATEPVVRPPSLWRDENAELSDGELSDLIRQRIASQDNEGRWIEDGWIRSQTFVDTAFAITDYLKR